MEGIAVFNDEFRDVLKGSTFNEQESGYASGNINGHFEPVKYGNVGGTKHPQVDYNGLLYCDGPYVGAPSQMVNFVSCHDGYTLADKLRLSVQGEYANGDKWKEILVAYNITVIGMKRVFAFPNRIG